jgi:hypothetical protein
MRPGARPDNTILAGFAAQSQNQGKLKVVGTFFSSEIYGIGLKKGDSKGVTAVDSALRASILQNLDTNAIPAAADGELVAEQT